MEKIIRPAKFEKYKKTSCLQLELYSPKEGPEWTNSAGQKCTELQAGSVMLTICPMANNQMQLEQIQRFKLGFIDIEKILYWLEKTLPYALQDNDEKGKSIALIHDPNAQTEAMGSVINQLSVFFNGTSFGFTLRHKENGEENVRTFFMSPEEMLSCQIMLRTALSKILGW